MDVAGGSSIYNSFNESKFVLLFQYLGIQLQQFWSLSELIQ